MITQLDTIRFFFEKIRHIGFFDRLFSWGRIRNQLVDVSETIGKLAADHQGLQNSRQELQTELSGYKKDLQLNQEQRIRLEDSLTRLDQILKEKENTIQELNRQLATAISNSANFENRVNALNNEMTGLKEKLQQTEQKLKDASRENIEYRQDEDTKKQEHARNLSTLRVITEQVRLEREKEKEEAQAKELERMARLKETWNHHQSDVKNTIRQICNKHGIEYMEQVPFKGEPDNTIKLCDEYIVFDAKSPGGEDLKNFPFYIKTQAEAAKKYARQEGVKNEIFFVIPSNALECLRQNTYQLADFTVYVISPDSLEPVMLALKKIENYEFAQQLTPEERENICRVIGKFAHLTKRRIQIDSFFTRQFMELVYTCESSLPDDILEKVADFEKAEKLNPPIEKRTKSINTKQLEMDVAKLETEIGSKGIVIEDLSENLNKARLYSEK